MVYFSKHARFVLVACSFLLAAGVLSPWQSSAAVEMTIQPISDQEAVLSVVSGQDTFNTGGLSTGWRTTRLLLALPFGSFDDDGVSSYGSQINSINQNGYPLYTSGGVSETEFGQAPGPVIIPPSLNLWFTDPTNPTSGTIVGSVDVLLGGSDTWGSVGTSGTVYCGYYLTGDYSTSYIGPAVGTYQIVPEPSTIALLTAASFGCLGFLYRKKK